MFFVLLLLFLLIVPVSSITWFLICLREYRSEPDWDAERRKSCKTRLTVSGVVLSVIAVAFLTLVVLFTIDIQNM